MSVFHVRTYYDILIQVRPGNFRYGNVRSG
jgi:hypothetical protein